MVTRGRPNSVLSKCIFQNSSHTLQNQSIRRVMRETEANKQTSRLNKTRKLYQSIPEIMWFAIKRDIAPTIQLLTLQIYDPVAQTDASQSLPNMPPFYPRHKTTSPHSRKIYLYTNNEYNKLRSCNKHIIQGRQEGWMSQFFRIYFGKLK